MGKQSVFLKYRIQLPLIGRLRADFLSVENDAALVRVQKAAQNPKQGRLSAAAGAKQGYEFLFVNIQIDSLQDDLTVEAFHDISKANQFLSFHYTSPPRTWAAW